MTPTLPTAYFGNLEYFYYLLKYDTVHIDSSEVYKKQTYRNRCTVLGANGPLNLSIPVERPFGKQTQTRQVLICKSENWANVHWKTLESCYNRTPYFEFYADKLKDILLGDCPDLLSLNRALTAFLIEKIGLDVTLDYSNQTIAQSQNLSAHFNPKIESGFRNFPYLQTFIERFGHQNNLSILDLLFNEGPNSICILEESKPNQLT